MTLKESLQTLYLQESCVLRVNFKWKVFVGVQNNYICIFCQGGHGWKYSETSIKRTLSRVPKLMSYISLYNEHHSADASIRRT